VADAGLQVLYLRKVLGVWMTMVRSSSSPGTRATPGLRPAGFVDSPERPLEFCFLTRFVGFFDIHSSIAYTSMAGNKFREYHIRMERRRVAVRGIAARDDTLLYVRLRSNTPAESACRPGGMILKIARRATRL